MGLVLDLEGVWDLETWWGRRKLRWWHKLCCFLWEGVRSSPNILFLHHVGHTQRPLFPGEEDHAWPQEIQISTLWNKIGSVKSGSPNQDKTGYLSSINMLWCCFSPNFSWCDSCPVLCVTLSGGRHTSYWTYLVVKRTIYLSLLWSPNYALIKLIYKMRLQSLNQERKPKNN